MLVTRRSALALAGAAMSLGAGNAEIDPAVIARHDEAVAYTLNAQITDPASPGCGTVPSRDEKGRDIGIYAARPASTILEQLTAALVCKGSRYYGESLLVERMKLAVRFLNRAQHPDGLVDYLDTNFDSAPDAGFTVWGIASAACLARRAGRNELVAMMEPFLRRAGAGLATGGVHTPNHRWVMSSALAQIYELFPDGRYVKRIDQWLAEGIDIDADGQYSERSSGVYNAICNRSFVVMAAKLKRPELLDPVRRNLQSMLYLLHGDGSLVTEISRRQDRGTRADMSGYWFPLCYMAKHDGNGQFAKLATAYSRYASLSALMEYPEMAGSLPPQTNLPANFARTFSDVGIVRFRRGPISSTLLSGNPTLFTTRKGSAAVRAVRAASAFFGKGQFIAERLERKGDEYWLTQSLSAGYYQPLQPVSKVTTENWEALRPQRVQTAVQHLQQQLRLRESKSGFTITFAIEGTKDVPVAIEISLDDSGTIEGCESLGPASYLLSQGFSTYRTADGVLRIGPGLGAHRWTTIRGALPRHAGRSIYLTGFAPLSHTISLEWT